MSALFFKNIVPNITIAVVIRVTIPQITTQAIAVPFFCFCTRAMIPKINHSKASGIPKKAHITVSDSSNQTILNTRLVVESHDFCSVFLELVLTVLVVIKISLNNKLYSLHFKF
ncbi:MAG: hypothetical protein B6229_08095 [Spirochaetaceae bacterium 4572_7]|nr:MAG: hypothetical protein B6229_08095 [Spirochaetaceae bacterium 4572_7]